VPGQTQRRPNQRQGSERLKILHVIPSIGLARGGPSVVLRTLANAQAALGSEVHVACTDDNGPAHLTPSDVPDPDGAVRYWIFRRQAYFYTVSFPLASWLRKHVRDYDIIHIHALFSHASVAAARIARSAKVPYIVEPHGLLNRWGMRERRPRLKRLSFQMIETPILRGAAAVLYSSEQEALEAGQLGVEYKSLMIPNPVDLPSTADVRGRVRASHPELPGRTVVLFLSRLDPKKGLDLLLPAFAKLRESHPEAVLLVVGDGDSSYVASLKRDAQKLHADGGLIWAGFLDGDDKRAVLADADLFVLPSYSENFGMAVVEAMGAGLPVVVSDQVGIHREVSRAGAGFVVNCSPEQIESALSKLTAEPDLRKLMGIRAQGLARQFSPENVARRLVEAYEKVLHSLDVTVAA
jgi:glycosyltransferase involved in cell wall biosynthesis